MKKIFLFISFIFLFAVCKSQTTYPISQNLGADSTLILNKGGLSISKNVTGIPPYQAPFLQIGNRNNTQASVNYNYGLLLSQNLNNLAANGGMYGMYSLLDATSTNVPAFVVGGHFEADGEANLGSVEGVAGVASLQNSSGSATLTGNLRGSYISTTTSGAGTKTIPNAFGVWLPQIYTGGAATITNNYGILIDKNSTIGVGNFSAATITNDYGLYISNATNGNITNKYGLYLENFGTSQYSIYSAGGKVRFANLLAAPSTDTTTYKPLGVNASGDLANMATWAGGGGVAGWGLSLNTISGGLNLIGTANNRSMDFYSNGIKRGRLDSLGVFNIDTAIRFNPVTYILNNPPQKLPFISFGGVHNYNNPTQRDTLYKSTTLRIVDYGNDSTYAGFGFSEGDSWAEKGIFTVIPQNYGSAFYTIQNNGQRKVALALYISDIYDIQSYRSINIKYDNVFRPTTNPHLYIGNVTQGLNQPDGLGGVINALRLSYDGAGGTGRTYINGGTDGPGSNKYPLIIANDSMAINFGAERLDGGLGSMLWTGAAVGQLRINYSSNPGNSYKLVTGGGMWNDFTGSNLSWTFGGDATGDMYYRNSSGFVVRLPIGATTQTLHVVGGVPKWVDTLASSGGTSLTVNTTPIVSGNINDILFQNTSSTLGEDNNFRWITPGLLEGASGSATYNATPYYISLGNRWGDRGNGATEAYATTKLRILDGGTFATTYGIGVNLNAPDGGMFFTVPTGQYLSFNIGSIQILKFTDDANAINLSKSLGINYNATTNPLPTLKIGNLSVSATSALRLSSDVGSGKSYIDGRNDAGTKYNLIIGNDGSDIVIGTDGSGANAAYWDNVNHRLRLNTTNQGAYLLQIAGDVWQQGKYNIAGATSGLVTLQTAAAAGTWSLTLPTSGGTANYFLSTDGTGITSWADPNAISGSIAVINDTDYTVAAGVKYVTYRTMTAGRTVTVPAAASNSGRAIYVKNGGNGAFGISFSLTIRVNTVVNLGTLGQGNSVLIVSDGTDWWAIMQGT
jgi:hypothetical protein